MAGCVVAAGGALDQPYHSDGDEQLFNCFVPLVSVSALNGPTEFVCGSHEEDSSPSVGAKPSAGGSTTACALRSAESERLLVAPQVAVGELCLFDYRVEHRGRANATASSRPVAYVVYAPKDVEHDQFNFPLGVTLLPESGLDPVDRFYAMQAVPSEPGAGEDGTHSDTQE